MNKPNVKQFSEFQAKATERLGRDIFGTAGGESRNHKELGALDFGTLKNQLTHKEYLTLGLTASEFGFRVGDERATNHLHVDNTTTKEDGTPTAKAFERVTNPDGSTSTRDTEDSVFLKMKKEIDNGMSFDDAINWGKYNDFSNETYKGFKEEKPVPTDDQIKEHVLSTPVAKEVMDEMFIDTLGLKLTDVKGNPNKISEALLLGDVKEASYTDPEGQFKNVQQNINKTKEVDGYSYPQRESKEADLGGGSSYQGQPLASSVVDTVSDFTGRMVDYASSEKDFEGSGKNLGDQFYEESAVGLVTQSLVRGVVTTKEVDPNFNPEADQEAFKAATEGLTPEQIGTLVGEYSLNEHDFTQVSQLMQARNKRKMEIEEYSKNHPVLSGINAGINLMSEAVLFSPVSATIGAGALAMKGGQMTFKSIGFAKSFGLLTGAELIEGGVVEGVKSTLDPDYEFSAPLFIGASLLGAGVVKALDSHALRKGVQEILKSEGGFINMSTATSKKLVKEIAKESDNIKAKQMLDELIKYKAEAANGLRKSLKGDHDSLVDAISVSKAAMKEAPKGSDAYKLAKGDNTRYVRDLKRLKKSMPLQFQKIADGTHEGLSMVVNPKMDIKKMAKEFEIPIDVVDSPAKIRDFFGLNGSKLADDVTVQGEKGYSNVLREQVTEMLDNKRLNMNTFLQGVSETMAKSPLDIDQALSKGITGLADTNSKTSKYLFNKGNYVSSDNELVAGFYNLIGSDGAGRQGMSKIRAGQTQQKYAKIFGGQMMDNYRTKGDELFKHLVNTNDDSVIKNKVKDLFDSENFEKIVEPIFNERLRLGKVEFAKKYADDPTKVRIADEFAKDWNKLNQDVNDLLKRKGVEGVDFKNTEDFVHSSWDFNKARAMPLEDLEEGIYQGMLKKLKDSNIEDIDEKFIMAEAKKFSFGIRSADISKNIEAQQGYIESLEKLVKRTDNPDSKETLKEEIRRLRTQKAANEAGDFANRAMIDLNVTLKDGRTLANLMEDNIIVSQKKYNQRMSARIAAAEHGIKDINLLDDWVEDAVQEQIKRNVKAGIADPERATKHLRESMEQDLKGFKHGNMAGRQDLLEQDAHDVIRLANKYNFARLMQRVGIASMAELSGTINEVGAWNFGKSYVNHFVNSISKRVGMSTSEHLDDVNEALSSITGIGLEDWAFTSRGVSGGERIFKSKGLASSLEKTVDKVGTWTQGHLGGIETFNRKMTMNAIANKFGKHFDGKANNNWLKAMFTGDSKLSNRTLENVGFGSYDPVTKTVKTNARYDLVKSNYTKHVIKNNDGSIKNLNLKDWDIDAVDAFADTIVMTSSHIMVDPDSVTSALWQNSSVGKIFTQYQSFSRNAKTKVFGYHANNAAIGIERGDYQEVAKSAQIMFVSGITGSLALMANAGLTGENAFETQFDGSLKQALAVGISRSSMNGGIDTLVDTVGGSIFGYDPIFAPASFTGRGKNIGDIKSTPIGQLGFGLVDAAKKVRDEDYTGAADKLFKLSPFQRQLGVAQLYKYLSE